MPTPGFSVSAHTKELIEEEVKTFIEQAYVRAKEILTERKDDWERLAQGLLEFETLTGEEIKRVMRGDPPQAGPDEDQGSDEGSATSVTAIPKTRAAKKKTPPSGGMEPEPSV